jgi:flagellar biosynthesis/type III secretory pathway protein FliH
MLFEEDFDLMDAPVVVAAEEEMSDPVAEATAAREAAYAQGLADGARQAAAVRADHAGRLTRLLEAGLQGGDEAIAEIAEITANGIALMMVQCLSSVVPDLCARHGGTEVAALARAILPGLRDEPRVDIALNPHDLAGVAAEIAALPTRQQERIALAPSDAVVAGNVQITWRDGHAGRDAQAVWEKACDVLRQYGFLDPSTPVGKTLTPAFG